jgi:LysM repeat protein
MNRRQLAFIILINALISLVIALMVMWVVESRRPDLEELAARYTPMPQAILAATPTVEAAESAPGESVEPVADAAPAPDSDESAVYIVQAGDSLLSIAGRYGITLDELVAANGLDDPNFVFSGQRLVIPAAGETIVAVERQADERGSPQIVSLEGQGDLANEAVLIVNESDTPVDLQEWRLEREDGPSYTFGSLPLFAGSSVRVYSTSGEDNSIARYWGESDPVWLNGAEVLLIDAGGEIVQRYSVP